MSDLPDAAAVPLDPGAVAAITRLSHCYALYADRGEASRIAELFTPDGVFTAPGMELRGREEIRRTFRRREQLHRLRTIHQLTGIVVDPAGPAAATGWVTLCLYRRIAPDAVAPAGETAPVLLGHYRDSYVRHDDSWLISRRTQHVSFADPGDPRWGPSER